jgi:hypothetical protein
MTNFAERGPLGIRQLQPTFQRNRTRTSACAYSAECCPPTGIAI